MKAVQRLIIPLATLLTILLFILLQSNNPLKLVILALFITSLWFAVVSIPRAGGTPFLRSLRRLLLINLIVMVFVTTLFTLTATVFAYYRWGWLVYALVTLALIIFVRAASSDRIDTASIPARRWQAIYWGLVGSSLCALIVALLLLPPHYSIIDLLLIFWCLGALPLATAAALGTIEGVHLEIPSSAIVTGSIAVIIAGSILSILSIRNFPNFTTTDEPWLINYVDTYQRTGVIDASMIPSATPVIIGHLWHYATTAWMYLVNGDSFGLRIFSTIGGFALLGIVFGITRKVHNSRTAWVAAALLSVNLAWLATSHIGRQEMWFTAAVWLAFWLSLLAERYPLLAGAAGLICALSTEIHALGAVACLALGIWWIIQWRSGHYSTKTLLVFVVGGLIGTLIYVLNHILPSPATFFSAIGGEMTGKGAAGFTPLLSVIPRHANYFESNPIEFILLIVGCVWAIRHGGKARSIGIFTVILFILYALLVSDLNLYYPMMWIPGLIVIYAMMINLVTIRWRMPLIVLILAAAVLNGLLVRNQVADGWNERVLQVQNEVRAMIPDGDSVLANTLFYMAFRDPNFTATTYVYDEWETHGIEPWAVVQRFKPDWIINGENSTRYTPEFLTFSIHIVNSNTGLDETDLATEYSIDQVVDTDLGQFTIWRRRGDS